LIVANEIETLLDKMNAYSPLSMGKWIEDIVEESNPS